MTDPNGKVNARMARYTGRKADDKEVRNQL
jgi:hypothetical protein